LSPWSLKLWRKGDSPLSSSSGIRAKKNEDTLYPFVPVQKDGEEKEKTG